MLSVGESLGLELTEIESQVVTLEEVCEPASRASMQKLEDMALLLVGVEVVSLLEHGITEHLGRSLAIGDELEDMGELSGCVEVIEHSANCSVLGVEANGCVKVKSCNIGRDAAKKWSRTRRQRDAAVESKWQNKCNHSTLMAFKFIPA